MPRSKPRFRRWTADTEVAFLMALRLTGSVTKACAEIGRSTHGAGDRRRRMPEFAAKWQQVLDEWQAEQAAERRTPAGLDDPGLMANRVRYDGFTPLRQRAFLRVLTETGKYQDAAKAVGLSEVAARNMRRRFPAFAEACDRAIARSAGTLEQAAFERAVEGVEEPVWHAGKLVGTRRRYSDALLGRMLGREARAGKARASAPAALVAAAHEAAKAAGGSFHLPASAEETNASILKKLAAIERRMRQEAADAAVALLEAGLVP